MKIFDYKKYHFVGIGGIGVSAVARMLFLQGKIVTGSDSGQSEITDDLEKLGIKIFIGQKAENIEENTEVIIYSVAIKESNPEMTGAKSRSLICISYPEAIGELSKEMFTIAVSGTHGKTTTTAMLGHILRKANLDPTVIVGSKILGENSNFLAGKSKYLVVEACEYRRSFLNLSPTVLIITNIEADHLDYYKDIEDIRSAFREIANKVPAEGFVVADLNGENIKEVISGAKAKILDYSLAQIIKPMAVSGRHNILDAQAAIKAAGTLGIDEKTAGDHLSDFRGTWRRLECKGEKDGNVYYDDYAHHPTEIRASLSALREKHPDREIVCVFEPHQQGRLKLFFEDFVESLKLADKVFVAPIFVTREIDDQKTTNKTLSDAINKFVPAFAVQSLEELKSKIKSLATLENQTKPLCIVLMGAGNIYEWTDDLLK